MCYRKIGGILQTDRAGYSTVQRMISRLQETYCGNVAPLETCHPCTRHRAIGPVLVFKKCEVKFARPHTFVLKTAVTRAWDYIFETIKNGEVLFRHRLLT